MKMAEPPCLRAALPVSRETATVVVQRDAMDEDQTIEMSGVADTLQAPGRDSGAEWHDSPAPASNPLKNYPLRPAAVPARYPAMKPGESPG